MLVCILVTYDHFFASHARIRELRHLPPFPPPRATYIHSHSIRVKSPIHNVFRIESRPISRPSSNPVSSNGPQGSSAPHVHVPVHPIHSPVFVHVYSSLPESRLFYYLLQDSPHVPSRDQTSSRLFFLNPL